MLLPDPNRLSDQIENTTEQTYECSECKKMFQGNTMESEELPDNFIIAGIPSDQKIPKCPHCGHLAFFGFKVVDIAF